MRRCSFMKTISLSVVMETISLLIVNIDHDKNIYTHWLDQILVESDYRKYYKL